MVSIEDAKKWRESRHCAAITGYFEAIIDENSAQASILSNAFCSCGRPICLDGTGREHCEIDKVKAQRGVRESRGRFPPQLHICWSCGEMDCDSGPEPKEYHVCDDAERSEY